jgi:hypothetical protein
VDAGGSLTARAFPEHADAEAAAENSRAIAGIDGPNCSGTSLCLGIDPDRSDARTRYPGTTDALAVDSRKSVDTRALSEDASPIAYADDTGTIDPGLCAKHGGDVRIAGVAR